MSDHYTITDLARATNVPPKVLSNWFWSGELDRERCQKIGNRLLIPRDYVEWVIVPLLRRRGYNPRPIPSNPSIPSTNEKAVPNGK